MTGERTPNMKILYGIISPRKTILIKKTLTVGGNIIGYPRGIIKCTAELAIDKICFNRTVYTPGGRFMCCKIKKCYLGTPMKRCKNIQLPINLLED